MSRLSRHVSVLQVRFLILDGQADWPVVQVLVDGREAFVDWLPGWQGFDPADMLGDQSPLLPEDGGHRGAVYRRSCGIAGCGVIAPVIMLSPDGSRVSWVDLRDYTGVFDGPAAPDGDGPDPQNWGITRSPTQACQRGILRPAGAEPDQRDHSEPELAARDILDQLQAVPAGQWGSRFGWQRSRRWSWSAARDSPRGGCLTGQLVSLAATTGQQFPASERGAVCSRSARRRPRRYITDKGCCTWQQER